MRSANAVRVLLATAVIAGCGKARPNSSAPATAEEREAVFLTKNVATGRHCSIVDAGAPLPAVETLIDTAAMPEYLKQTGVAADSGYALYSLRFDGNGKPVRARLIEATIPESLLQPLQQALASALIDRGVGEPLAGRLRIDFSPVPSYRVGKSEYCKPEQIPQPANMSQSVMSATVPAGPGAARMRIVSTIKYELVIAPSGIVTDVRFATVDPSVQPAAREALFKNRWRPALDDALPVEARVTGEINDVAVLSTRPN